MEWSVGRRIATGIAMALGAVGSAYTGGPNQALAVIKLGMQRDAEDYRRKMAGRQARLQTKKTMYDVASSHFDDIESQILAAQAEVYQQTQRQISLEAAKMKSPLVQANAAKVAEALNVEHAKTMAQLGERRANIGLAYGTAISNASMNEKRYRQQQQALRQQRSMAIQKRQEAVRAAAAKEVKEQKMLHIPGLARNPNVIPNKQKHNEAVVTKSAYDEAAPLFDELISKLEAAPAGMLWADESEDANQLANDLNNALRRANKAGANFTEMERELQGVVSDPGDAKWALQRLKTARRNFNRRSFRELLNRGYILPGQGPRRGQKVSGE